MFKQIKTIMVSFVLTLALMGCAVSEFIEERPATTALILNYATMKMIEGSSNPFGRAARTVEVIDDFREYVKNNNLDGNVTINDLVAIGRTFINWEDMPMSDRLLVEALFQEVTLRFQKKVEDNIVTDSDTIHIFAALDIIRDTASRMSTKAS